MLTRCTSRNVRSNYLRLTLSHKSWLRRYATTDSVPVLADRTRNIGIIAHIDAGKTTTTERMLYYAGYTRQLGDVDQGSTITDFLPAERARGITIQSAAITFSWPPSRQTNESPPLDPGSPRSSVPHNINLIDTPGHADFTFEVLRSLRVLDGAVCILDSVAGVEAQTEKVWSQASAYSIPRIVFVNKLDRDGAAFARTVREIGSKLNAWPAVCGIPWWNADGKLQGVGDVVNLKALAYPAGGDGKQVQFFNMDELEAKDPKFKAELVKARTALIELLAEHDDQMVEQFFEVNEDHMVVQPKDVRESLRRCTLSSPQRVTAIFAGASFRNVAVQPLLDAVVDLLPSPEERPDPQISYDAGTSRNTLSKFLKGDGVAQATDRSKSKALAGRNNMSLQAIGACALAFKVVSDPRRGVLVYVRVYSGRLARNANLWNTTLQVNEKSQRLLRMYANDAVDVDEIEAGQIGVIPALKFTRTGDSLISHPTAHTKTGPPPPASQLQLRPIDVPPPVFFVSVEPNSLSETRHVKECLELLLREDPSLNVRIDEESGQTLLAGMGELHLEIARDRLVQDLKAKARTGNIEIGYRETVNVDSGEVHEVYDKELNGKRSEASCTARVAPMSDINALHGDHTISLPDENILTIDILGLDQDGDPLTSELPALPDDLPLQDVLHAFQNGTIAALARGPQHGYSIHSTAINITLDRSKDIAPSTTATTLATVARLAVQSALQKSNSMQEVAMMEPVMRVAISLPESYLGAVVQDISSGRGGSVLSLDASQSEDSSELTHRDDPVDVKRIYVPPDPFGSADASLSSTSDRQIVRTIVARVPLKEMVGYLKHLRSLTAGRGTFTMSVDRFDRMGSQRVKAMLTALRGQDF